MNLFRTLARRLAGLNNMRNLVVDGAGRVITVTAGGGAARATAAVAVSVDEGGTGPGAGAGTAAAGAAAGAAAVAKPVAESATSAPHCRQFKPGRKCRT